MITYKKCNITKQILKIENKKKLKKVLTKKNNSI